jgi:hypothetical protein
MSISQQIDFRTDHEILDHTVEDGALEVQRLLGDLADTLLTSACQRYRKNRG